MAVRRIDRYEGERVTYHYRSHRTDRVAHETVDVHMFIGRMVQHVLPKGFMQCSRLCRVKERKRRCYCIFGANRWT